MLGEDFNPCRHVGASEVMILVMSTYIHSLHLLRRRIPFEMDRRETLDSMSLHTAPRGRSTSITAGLTGRNQAMCRHCQHSKMGFGRIRIDTATPMMGKDTPDPMGGMCVIARPEHVGCTTYTDTVDLDWFY